MAGGIIAATCALVFWLAWESDRAEIEEHRALFFASALAHISSVHGDYEAQRFIAALPSVGDASSDFAGDIIVVVIIALLYSII